ncbi:GNAT family N-acetyltransferase [Streptomyces sp. NBC_00963]|uniref:GNAT family N-acetyltransferase n=1 Tax=Streptomyces sp. NBC_00963 TaxID=2903697 RepID=UPI0038632576|nr:GNAT family N-acetyltransferase [Streptomyces sp. NBC_00963]
MKIRSATVADLDVISEMLGEIEEYYGGENTPGDHAQIRTALFGERPHASVLLALDDDDVVGLASYTFLWPAAGADSSLYLKELYVREHARRRGVAAELMMALSEAAGLAGCSRIEWTADTENPPALAFYAAQDAERRAGKVFYRLEHNER